MVIGRWSDLKISDERQRLTARDGLSKDFFCWENGWLRPARANRANAAAAVSGGLARRALLIGSRRFFPTGSRLLVSAVRSFLPGCSCGT